SKDEQLTCCWVRRESLLLPPLDDCAYGELWRIVRHADDDVPCVLHYVIDPERDRHALGRAREAVFVHFKGVSAPQPARVSEVPDQLLLLCIHTNDRQPFSGEEPSLVRD